MMPIVIGDDRRDLDPAVADQMTSMIVTTGLSNFQLNAANGRNHLAATMTGLTLAVQRGQMASLHEITRITPMAAAAAANLQSAQTPYNLVRNG
jgi:hypothetical protein